MASNYLSNSYSNANLYSSGASLRNQSASGYFSQSVGSASAAIAGSSDNRSRIEQAILSAVNPIDIQEREEISANGVRGIWANKSETAHIRNLEKYRLNNDSNPQVIRKKPTEKVKYTQEVSVRYLKPPAPPKPGDIIVKQQQDVQEPAAPPLVIRQAAQRPKTPQPLIIRERPPKAPEPVPEKVITVPGKVIPPPPRKVVIEKLPEIPAKPQNIIIEKWLPYEDAGARRVIYEKPCSQPQPSCPPKNVVIEWEKPCVEIKQEFKELGVVQADPEEYRRRYNFNKDIKDLPSIVGQLSAQARRSSSSSRPRPVSSVLRLEGDVEALRLVDLEREGLSQYRSLLN